MVAYTIIPKGTVISKDTNFLSYYPSEAHIVKYVHNNIETCCTFNQAKDILEKECYILLPLL